MILSGDLQQSAFRSGEEYAWRRAEALRVVDMLEHEAAAVLGGEVWIIVSGRLLAAVPQSDGPPAIEHWSSERAGGDDWPAYVKKAAIHARAAILSIPDLSAANLPQGAIVYYNLTWALESEYKELLPNQPLQTNHRVGRCAPSRARR